MLWWRLVMDCFTWPDLPAQDAKDYDHAAEPRDGGDLAGSALGLAGAVATAGVGRIEVSSAKGKLSAEKLDRANENGALSRAALRYAETQMAKQAAHAAKQTEIANALEKLKRSCAKLLMIVLPLLTAACGAKHRRPTRRRP